MTAGLNTSAQDEILNRIDALERTIVALLEATRSAQDLVSQ